MLVCIDKITCVRMHRLIEFYWNEYANELEAELGLSASCGCPSYGTVLYITHRFHCAPRKEGF